MFGYDIFFALQMLSNKSQSFVMSEEEMLECISVTSKPMRLRVYMIWMKGGPVHDLRVGIGMVQTKIDAKI